MLLVGDLAIDDQEIGRLRRDYTGYENRQAQDMPQNSMDRRRSSYWHQI
jgi:hypothetical protein